MAEKESEDPKLKPRLLVRIGVFIISHSAFVSVVCFTAGILALILLPVLAKNTYVSENALMPGSDNPMFSGHETMEAKRLVKDIMSIKRKSEDAGTEIPRVLAHRIAESGAEVYHHKFHAQKNQFDALDFFSGSSYSSMTQEKHNCNAHGVNSVGIIRAPQGDGKEAIVLVTPYNSTNIQLCEALSLGLAYSIFSLFSRVNWLAKDIIWLAADSRYGEYVSVSAWLKDYHNPVFISSHNLDNDICEFEDNPITEDRTPDIFRRAGTMAAALVLKVADTEKQNGKDTLSIYAEASNGQMPNLDLINVVHYLAVHRQGLRVKVNKILVLFNSSWLKVIGEILEFIGKIAKGLNPKWQFGISAADYVEGTATLASSIYNQALGVPTGSHGAFRDYQVDAITLEISPKLDLSNEARQSEFFLRGGRLIEGVVRSVNNLLEKFHQSFFLYLMTGPSKFVSVGVYMIGFALLIAPLPIVAASLYSEASKQDSTSGAHVPPKSRMWLHAAKTVFLVHLWGTLVSLLPSLIYQLPNRTALTSMLSWVSLSFLTLLALYGVLGSPYSYPSRPLSQNKEWAILKSVMIAFASIGLGTMSIINFATAQIAALLIVPMCLISRPLKLADRDKRFRGLMFAACNIVLLFIGFPPVSFLMLKGWSDGFGNSVGDFWNWAESLWLWNSATYLYLMMIHLPCWVLCIHVLLHP